VALRAAWDPVKNGLAEHDRNDTPGSVVVAQVGIVDRPIEREHPEQ
jgi:hypothetical protein